MAPDDFRTAYDAARRHESAPNPADSAGTAPDGYRTWPCGNVMKGRAQLRLG
jgi:hypothetical protein